MASQVLDYWFTIEFLEQDSYDTCTEKSKIERELKKFKKEDQSVKNKRKQISVFELINSENDIYAQIVRQAKACGMRDWGNLTFYIGSISRQACIEKIAQKLGLKLNQGEKNLEDIPILSFQCTMNGIYVEHTLSLSTIVWAISQIEKKPMDKLSSLLSRKAYSATIEELENKFFAADNFRERSNAESSGSQLDLERMPVFVDGAITVSKIIDIFSTINTMYGGFFHEDIIKEKNGIKYQLFKDKNAKNKYNDDNYMGISHDFFSNDLEMIKASIEKEKDDYSTGMLFNLMQYICAPNDVSSKKHHDLLRPKDKKLFYQEIAEILNVGNAPLGKWPSRYMPSLFQQVAINIAIANHHRGIFTEKGNIFSVNGPPGTGKTTLLKEIIANDIVEKAKFLSQYEHPDDAFEGVRFKYGKINGAYTKFYPRWFKFKDTHIADYGVLVTSCNNTAVENITKELPLENIILDNSKVILHEKESHNDEIAQQCKIIQDLFSVSETKRKLKIYRKNAKWQGDYPEIYFTGYAKKLFGDGEKFADAWGLIAAPLGKKSNINRLYYDVLNPIWQDFLIRNIDIEDRISEYEKAREEFTKQLALVNNLQIKLKGYGDVSLESYKLQAKFVQKQKDNSNRIRKCEEKIRYLENQLIDMNKDIEKEEIHYSDIKKDYMEAACKVKQSEEKIKFLLEQELDFKKQAFDLENSVCFFTKIFKKSKYQSALDLAHTYRLRAQKCTEDLTLASQKILEEKKVYQRHCSDKERTLKNLQELKITVKQIEKNKLDIQNEILQLKEAIEYAQKKAEVSKMECSKSLKEYLNENDISSGTVLDEAFIDDVLSKNDKVSTKAHLANPWMTEKFNREREKLFYLALQMTREFFLSSKSCRANLCILGQYWGHKTETDSDRIIFHRQDSKEMIASLFHTLLLLTPVISSTFASVGRLFKDMKKPGCIGTLIIDEAGQAQPQMAVGALYRSRKAIIVGDPNQVEPVVTDDLKLLKEVYSNPVLEAYKDKSLSVQRFADQINPFGAFLDNGTDYPNWIGCPLVVHRRCISPMYEISNNISYGGMMKQQSKYPSDSENAALIYKSSKWLNVAGIEKGHGNHYVAEQGSIVCQMVETAFQKAMKLSETKIDAKPNLYIISPFNTVVLGLKKAIEQYANKNKASSLANNNSFVEWLNESIGTVHKFQGKETNEVIFVLGCDKSQKEKYSVKGFVNSNIVNVAVTRAKYRLYIVGDIDVWRTNKYINEAKSIMEMYSDMNGN